ncbi:trigger factor [Desulfatitalea alkaliphila]|uniref:Trigger factor n=1 Tax=Desulfatitalea alkaliphila TaxID=2929485 RepID=A0AA41R3T5_9BACT|nr:trigger factor [Desulfatitalea alkaliphila]MCJ8500390.1 trigger factor [Desulfatitalea alkaliphila]
MKVTVEDQSSVKKVLHIEVPADTVTSELDKAYKEVAKTAKIKGFRPGKAPRSVLERMFRKDVHADVSSKLIQEGFLAAVREKDLKIIGPPTVEPPELTPNSAYAFDAVVEVRPEIPEIAYKSLELTKSAYQVSDEEIDLQLKMVQRNMAKQDKVEEDRPLADGDVAVIDYEGFKDGNPHEATRKTENFAVKLGDGRVVKDLEAGLVGMKVGDEKEIDVAFPEDYFSKELAGQKLQFKVRLNEIRQETLPPLDDELARSIGDRFESLDALKEKIRENLQSGYDKRIEQELNEQVFTQLLEKAPFEVPESMVESELEHILKDAERSFEQSNRSLEDAGLSREALAEKYRPVAEKQVRRHFILAKLVEQEQLTLDDEALEQGFRDMAASFGQPVEQVKAYYQQDPDSLEFFKHTLLEKKALKIIIDNNTITEAEAAPKTEGEAANS